MPCPGRISDVCSFEAYLVDRIDCHYRHSWDTCYGVGSGTSVPNYGHMDRLVCTGSPAVSCRPVFAVPISTVAPNLHGLSVAEAQKCCENLLEVGSCCPCGWRSVASRHSLTTGALATMLPSPSAAVPCCGEALEEEAVPDTDAVVDASGSAFPPPPPTAASAACFSFSLILM